MNIKEVEKTLLEKFPDAPFSRDGAAMTGAQWSITVPISGIKDAAKAFDANDFFLESMTALDFEDTFELVYHFNCYEPNSRVVVRMLCGHDQAAPSIFDIFRAAGWFEREVHEFFGIKFSGNPDLRTLLLPEDADYHPLRKTFGKVNAYHKREVIYG